MNRLIVRLASMGFIMPATGGAQASQEWPIHSRQRPQPAVVEPGTETLPAPAPKDAIILFNGTDLSRWVHPKGEPARWIVRDGYFEVRPDAGNLMTRDSFGDVQLHVEWSTPNPPAGTSQDRGNSGIYLMSRYEVQVLDSYQSPTYADGQAGAIYGQWPPLVNPARKLGEWNSYDIVFEAPKFDGDKLKEPAYITVFYNGVVVHNRKASYGATVYRQVAQYARHEAKEPLQLQDHGHPVWFRNIWIRPLGQYDRSEK